PRLFEPWPDDEDDTRVGKSSLNSVPQQREDSLPRWIYRASNPLRRRLAIRPFEIEEGKGKS
ncbi:hypothetical protein AVEN_189701-1, partial [Araneus ventricosus]